MYQCCCWYLCGWNEHLTDSYLLLHSDLRRSHCRCEIYSVPWRAFICITYAKCVLLCWMTSHVSNSVQNIGTIAHDWLNAWQKESIQILFLFLDEAWCTLHRDINSYNNSNTGILKHPLQFISVTLQSSPMCIECIQNYRAPCFSKKKRS